MTRLGAERSKADRSNGVSRGGESGGAGSAEGVVARLKARLGAAKFARFFEPTARLGVEGTGAERVVVVRVPTAFYADWLGRQFGDDVRAAACQELGVDSVEVRWEVVAAPVEAGDGRATANGTAVAPAAVIATIGPEGARRNGAAGPGGMVGPSAPAFAARLRLDEFVVGESNRLAYNAAIRLAEGEEQRGPFGVLFIHGTTGVGKTHLLQGIARRFIERRPGARVRSVTCEQFVNEYVASIHGGNIEGFRARYRHLDLLCLDDVHFLGGKEKSQSEFLHTFDALDLSGARVALASDEHPRHLQRLTRQITSRLVSGMVVRVDPPDEQTRCGLVKLIAARRGIALDEASVRSLASARRASVRELEGAIASVEATARLLGHDPAQGVPAGAVARAVSEDSGGLGGGGRGGVRKPVRMSAILSTVCERLGVEPSDVLGRGRHKRVVLARSVCSWLARQLTTHSFPEIARALGRENHSTVVTACQRLKAALERGDSCDCGPGLELTLEGLIQSLRAEVLAA
ncbi:MAG: DnaA ATPase domain-containing protein [Phycisphaerales bacterium]